MYFAALPAKGLEVEMPGDEAKGEGRVLSKGVEADLLGDEAEVEGHTCYALALYLFLTEQFDPRDPVPRVLRQVHGGNTTAGGLSTGMQPTIDRNG